MGDIRDWGAFVRGRWDWTRYGYEHGFPRGCQFTDVDAAVEFDGRSLLIEAKLYDGTGQLPSIEPGQRYYLRDEARRGKTVYVLWGCGVCNDPYALKWIKGDKSDDEFFDWRGLDKDERRKLLKEMIDRAMGLSS